MPKQELRRRVDPEELGLRRLAPVDPDTVRTVDDLARAMSGSAFTGRQLGEATDLFEKMCRDRRSYTFCSISGAMTVGQQGLLISKLIDLGYIDGIVATGALIAHGMVEEAGRPHYATDPSIPDSKLYQMGLNRITDCVEPESNFDEVERIQKEVMKQMQKERPGETFASFELTEALGRYLHVHPPEVRGILVSAFRRGESDGRPVKVYIPAIADSELGNNIRSYNAARRKRGLRPFVIDPNGDHDHLKYTYRDLKRRGYRVYALEIGGGHPRNTLQNAWPDLELESERLGVPLGYPHSRHGFDYGVRICPDPVHYGHLSGSTFEEAKSWGKVTKNAKTAEVLLDATVALPVMAIATMQRLGYRPKVKAVL